MRVRAALIGSLGVTWVLSVTAPSAQAIRMESVEDQVFGWIKIYNYKGATLPVKENERVYSPAQLSIAQLFANWMQASYLPTGALGDVVQTRNEKLNPYNQNTAALPQSYGAYAKLYTELKYGANRKIEPLTNSRMIWTIEANGFYGIPADAISTPQHYYFTLPTFAQQGYGAGGRDDLEKAADVSGHPVLGQFPAYFVRDSATGNRKYVLLSRDHRLPFVTITRGSTSTPWKWPSAASGTRRRRGSPRRSRAIRSGSTSQCRTSMREPQSGWRCSPRTGRSTGLACRRRPRSGRRNPT